MKVASPLTSPTSMVQVAKLPDKVVLMALDGGAGPGGTEIYGLDVLGYLYELTLGSGWTMRLPTTGTSTMPMVRGRVLRWLGPGEVMRFDGSPSFRWLEPDGTEAQPSLSGPDGETIGISDVLRRPGGFVFGGGLQGDRDVFLTTNPTLVNVSVLSPTDSVLVPSVSGGVYVMLPFNGGFFYAGYNGFVGLVDDRGSFCQSLHPNEGSLYYGAVIGPQAIVLAGDAFAPGDSVAPLVTFVTITPR
jgi:hypothetical protein